MTRLEQLQKLVTMTPNDPLAHYGVGLELIQQQRWSDAAAAFAQAVKVDGNYSAAYYHKGRAEISGGDYDTARATLTEGMAVAQRVGDWHTQEEMKALLATID